MSRSSRLLAQAVLSAVALIGTATVATVRLARSTAGEDEVRFPPGLGVSSR